MKTEILLSCRCGHRHRVWLHLGAGGTFSLATQAADCCDAETAAPRAVDPTAPTGVIEGADSPDRCRGHVEGGYHGHQCVNLGTVRDDGQVWCDACDARRRAAMEVPR